MNIRPKNLCNLFSQCCDLDMAYFSKVYMLEPYVGTSVLEQTMEPSRGGSYWEVLMETG